MSSTYYDYRDVKVMIAHKLMSMDGWKVYGYKPDESDSMTDYYSPAYWEGIAEKNGYILCVDVYGASDPKEIREYNYNNFTYSKDIREKIAKLEQMTVERGASQQEEESAKMMIKRLQQKAEQEADNRNKYIVIGIIPGHQAHPPKCNWHIEKDGVIVAKGNGILKYANVYNYYNYSSYMEDLNEYKKDKEAYKQKYINNIMARYSYYSEEQADKDANYHIDQLEKDIKLIDQFEQFIRKIDSTCGGMIGEGEHVIYEKIKVTEYKTENKAIEITTGSIKEGQCFILKSNFTYGKNKGYVYRIHERDYNGQKQYYAYKLNGKLTKECTGNANQANYWFIGSCEHDNLTKWINKGSIAWCEIKEVKTPYEVEKVIKKVVKPKVSEQQTTEEQPKAESNNNLTYDIKEDVDTRDNSKIFVVKVKEKLNKDEYIKVNNRMKSLGGYYSKFKHGFIFKDYPANLLAKENIQQNDCLNEQELTDVIAECVNTEEFKQPEEKPIDFDIQQKDNIWLVKIKNNLSKDKFAEVKRNFATLKGFYSSSHGSFIFKYDPTDKIINTT